MNYPASQRRKVRSIVSPLGFAGQERQVRAQWRQRSEGTAWKGMGKILVGKVKDIGHRPVQTKFTILKIMEQFSTGLICS